MIRTVLVDEIFGLDEDEAIGLPPTKTFHVGAWFTNPEDAAACGFDVSKPTPFNGEREAGPLGFVSTEDQATDFGPLCRNLEDCVIE